MTNSLCIRPDLKAITRELRAGLGHAKGQQYKGLGRVIEQCDPNWDLPKIEVSDPSMFTKQQIKQLKKMFAKSERALADDDAIVNIGNKSDIILDERKGIAFARYKLPVREQNRYRDHIRFRDMGDYTTIGGTSVEDIEELSAFKDKSPSALAKVGERLQRPFDRIRSVLSQRASSRSSTFAEMNERYLFFDEFQPTTPEGNRDLMNLITGSQYIR